jgi:hypothetical protein
MHSPTRRSQTPIKLGGPPSRLARYLSSALLHPKPSKRDKALFLQSFFQKMYVAATSC